MKTLLSLAILVICFTASAGARETVTPIQEALDPFTQELREGDKPYSIVEWLPADDEKPAGTLAGNAFSEVETVPASK